MFFKKSSDDPASSLGTDNVAISSIIGKGLTFTGNLSFTGKLRLDGKINGNVKGEFLIIGESGSVTGDIDIETCTCQGRVCGNIKAKDLNVVKGCRIDGNVETISLTVQSGAALNGEVKVDAVDLRLVKGGTPQAQQEETIEPKPKPKPRPKSTPTRTATAQQ